MSFEMSVVIPTHNRLEVLAEVIQALELQDRPPAFEVVVVDDGSTDGTADVAVQHGAIVIQHPRNLGYGAALKSGIRRADTAFVATMDADGQHSIAALQSLWSGRSEADMVVGARSGLYSNLWRMPGKWCLGVMARYLTRQPIPDLNSGLRVYKRDVLLRYMHLCPVGFSFTTTITLAMLSRGWRVTYVPIVVNRRPLGRSTVTAVTGFETILLVLRIVSLFHPLRVFVPGAMVAAGFGVLWGVPFALAGRGVSVGAMLAIVVGIVLFALGLICDQISQLRLERFE